MTFELHLVNTILIPSFDFPQIFFAVFERPVIVLQGDKSCKILFYMADGDFDRRSELCFLGSENSLYSKIYKIFNISHFVKFYKQKYRKFTTLSRYSNCFIKNNKLDFWYAF